MRLTLDTRGLSDLVKALGELKAEGNPDADRLALNRTLDWVYPRAIRKTAEITGMQQKRVRLVMRKLPARRGAALLQAAIVARDTFTSLKDFRPVQTKAGVVAGPWGKRRLFPHTFIGPNGHVFVRRKDGSLHKLFGPAIPNEMIRGEMEPVLEEARRVVFPKQLQFFRERAIDKAKSKHGV